MYNRPVKLGLKIPSRFGKKMLENLRGVDSHCINYVAFLNMVRTVQGTNSP